MKELWVRVTDETEPHVWHCEDQGTEPLPRCSLVHLVTRDTTIGRTNPLAAAESGRLWRMDVKILEGWLNLIIPEKGTSSSVYVMSPPRNVSVSMASACGIQWRVLPLQDGSQGGDMIAQLPLRNLPLIEWWPVPGSFSGAILWRNKRHRRYYDRLAAAIDADDAAIVRRLALLVYSRRGLMRDLLEDAWCYASVGNYILRNEVSCHLIFAPDVDVRSVTETLSDLSEAEGWNIQWGRVPLSYYIQR